MPTLEKSFSWTSYFFDGGLFLTSSYTFIEFVCSGRQFRAPLEEVSEFNKHKNNDKEFFKVPTLYLTFFTKTFLVPVLNIRTSGEQAPMLVFFFNRNN